MTHVPFAQLILMGAALTRRREAEAGTADPTAAHKRDAAKRSTALEAAAAASHARLRARG